MKISFLSFCILISAITSAQENFRVIKGYVFDSSNMKPLSGASILMNKQQGTVSGVDGLFQTLLNNVSSSQDSISVSFVGYSTQHVSMRKFFNGDTIFLQRFFSETGEVAIVRKRKSYLERSLQRRLSYLPNDSITFLYQGEIINTINDSLYYYFTSGISSVMFLNSDAVFSQTHSLIARVDSQFVSETIIPKKKSAEVMWYQKFTGAFEGWNDVVLNRLTFKEFEKSFEIKREYPVENQNGYNVISEVVDRKHNNTLLAFYIDTTSMRITKIVGNTSSLKRRGKLGNISKGYFETVFTLFKGKYVVSNSFSITESKRTYNGKEYYSKIVEMSQLILPQESISKAEAFFGKGVPFTKRKYNDTYIPNFQLPCIVSSEAYSDFIKKLKISNE